MIYNHARIPPWKWDGRSISKCPDCWAPLVAKRGEIVRWHWAHKTGGGSGGCYHPETEWHLAMKYAYLGFEHWDIEVPVKTTYGNFRVDALNRKTKDIREFIHTLDPSYPRKHWSLTRCNANILWIFDGNEFVTARARPCSNGGMRKFLKPNAYDLQRIVKGLVFWDENLWREWMNNIWYPCTGEASLEIVKRYHEAKRKKPWEKTA